MLNFSLVELYEVSGASFIKVYSMNRRFFLSRVIVSVHRLSILSDMSWGIMTQCNMSIW